MSEKRSVLRLDSTQFELKFHPTLHVHNVVQKVFCEMLNHDKTDVQLQVQPLYNGAHVGAICFADDLLHVAQCSAILCRNHE